MLFLTMTYFYDASGTPYAYTEDGITIYTFEGTAIAYIEVNSIYGFDGTHIAFYEDGNVWDDNGDVLLYTKDSRFGYSPLKPLKSLMPKKGLKSKKSLKGSKALKPKKPLKHKSWSVESPVDIFLSA